MSSPYPYELRIRALKLIEEGMSISKVRDLLNISRQTLHKWRDIKQAGGDIAPKMGYQKGSGHKIKDLEEFKIFIDNNKNKSLKELGRISGVSSATIWRGIQKLGYSYKKNFYSSKKR